MSRESRCIECEIVWETWALDRAVMAAYVALDQFPVLLGRATKTHARAAVVAALAGLGLPPPVVGGGKLKRRIFDILGELVVKVDPHVTLDLTDAVNELAGLLGSLGSQDDPPQGLRPLDREPALREQIVEAIYREVGTEPHPWDNARPHSIVGVGNAADAILDLLAPEPLAPPVVSRMQASEAQPSGLKSLQGEAGKP